MNVAGGKTVALGKPGLYASLIPAPDGEHLLVEAIHHPYSYLTAHTRFPREVEIWNLSGARVQNRFLAAGRQRADLGRSYRAA